MGDHVADLPQYPKREATSSVAKDDMDAQRFAHISDLTYSAAQVNTECAPCVCPLAQYPFSMSTPMNVPVFSLTAACMCCAG